MSAPDEHWLLVKNLWLPVENNLELLGASGEDVREKIDSLSPMLGVDITNKLHYLRMERNKLLHENRPLNDAGKWEKWALEVATMIENVLAHKKQEQILNTSVQQNESPASPSARMLKRRHEDIVVGKIFKYWFVLAFIGLLCASYIGYQQHGMGAAITYGIIGGVVGLLVPAILMLAAGLLYWIAIFLFWSGVIYGVVYAGVKIFIWVLEHWDKKPL